MADQASSSITIRADRAAVMAVIADFAAYPEWTGSVKSAEVVAGTPPRPEQVHFVLDAGVIKDDYTLSYVWAEDDARVDWTLVKGQLQKAQRGSYELRDQGNGSTEVTYTLSIDLAMPMLGMLRRKGEKMIMDTALKDLKKRVEA